MKVGCGCAERSMMVGLGGMVCWKADAWDVWAIGVTGRSCCLCIGS